ncbi:MAG: inositol monophosphatase [Candidatus Pacebacteria bacterium]|jgi:myo-inositol-1(or 4)-monophosphatase|nr:inositol monophosphatase [Candidatus Paceibacterota bacterium]
MPESLDEYPMIAAKTAQLAGDFLMRDFDKRPELSFREDRHGTILQDRASDEIYRDVLKKEMSQVPVYSEENQSGLEDGLVWVVDSLDGTSNYQMGLPLFSTQICLLRDREPVVSVIYCPALRQIYTAEKDRGAFLNGKRIFAGNVDDIAKAALVQGKGLANINKTAWYLALFGRYVRTVRILGGCTGIDLALLASGSCEMTLNLNSKPYDFAPGVLLAREAGAVVANLKGDPWTVADDSMVAAGPILMPKILEIIRQASTNV